jgi:hypothetical protein
MITAPANHLAPRWPAGYPRGMTSSGTLLLPQAVLMQ